MGCNPSKNHLELNKMGNKFMNDPSVTKLFANPSNLVVKKFQQLFGFKPSEWKAWEPTKTDLKKFKGELNYMLKWIRKGKIGGLFGRNAYTTSGVVRRMPILGELYDNLLKVQHTKKGREITTDIQFQKVLEFLKNDGIQTGMVESSGSFTKARKRLQKYEEQIEKLLIDIENGVPGAREKLKTKEGELDVFLSKGEGFVFKNFVELIESKDAGLRSIKEITELTQKLKGKSLNPNHIKIIKDAIRNSNITDSANMRNALVEYVELMHNAYNTLSRGVDAYIDAVESGMLAKGVTDIAELQNVRTKLKEKLLPDEKIGYFPHYRYDLNSLFLDGLMPKLQKLVADTNIGNEPGIKGAVDQVDLMKAAMDDINLYVSKRVKPRTKDLDSKNYSMNFPVTIKRYLDEINRFNYVAHTQKYTRDALKEGIKTFKAGKDLDGYGLQFVEFVKELNSAQLGTREITNPEWNHLSRAILNMEFVSKLGFNLRSGVKNATQGLLNFVEFGLITQIKMRKFYNDPAMAEAVDLAMAESGLRFEGSAYGELTGITEAANPFSQRVKLAGNEIVFTKPSKMSQFADFTGKAASRSGVIMRGVENFNRRYTYQLGFYKMYDSLQKNTGYYDLVKKNTFKGKMSDKQWKSHIMQKSKNYAERMVTLLHFDYSSVSKSQLLRSPVGRFMFQFQHYGMKFAEYNFGLGRNAKHGLMAGEWRFSGEVGKAYRAGIVYFGVPALLSALFKNDFFNVIQHDTANRINQWWNFFTGDEEDFQKATYGRGAIGALVGAPVVSDFLALGELAELWELDEDGWAALLAGYNDMVGVTGDQKIKKLASIINVQAGRAFYHTGDLVFDGNAGRGLMFEAGLYPTARAKKYREYLATGAEYILPEGIYEALDRIHEHQEKARSKSGSSGGRVLKR